MPITINGTGSISGLTATGISAQPKFPGNVLQVVQSSLTSVASTSSTSYVSTGLTATITPSSSSNKILAIVDGMGSHSEVTGGQGVFRLVRNSPSAGTAVNNQAVSPFNSNQLGETLANVEGQRTRQPVNAVLLDSPSTTSSITYTLNFLTTQGTIYLGRWGTDGNFIQATHLTLMEIAA